MGPRNRSQRIEGARGRVVRTLAATAVVSAVLCGGAAAIPVDYFDLEGGVRGDRQASVGIRFDRVDGERVIAPFRADFLRMECRGGNTQRTGSLNFGSERNPIRIDGRDRTFSKRIGDGSQGGRVTGELLGGGEARGTVRYHADEVFALRDCETGELRWHAGRRVP